MPLPLSPHPTAPSQTPLRTLHLPRAEAVTLTASTAGDPADVVAAVAAWHDDTHPGAWPFCDQQLCHAVQVANGNGVNNDTGRATNHPEPEGYL